MKLIKSAAVFFILSFYISAVFAADADLNKKVINLAKNSLYSYLKYGHAAGNTNDLKSEKSRGVFVTLTKGGKVCGCMGAVFPKRANLGEEIAKNTILAASADTRYPKITLSEFPEIKYNISFVKNPRQSPDVSQLNPAKFGLLVTSGKKGAALLPGEAKTAAWQESECRRKAGILPNEPVIMYIFETDVVRD